MGNIKYIDSTGMEKYTEKIKQNFAASEHKHTKADITDFPTIPGDTKNTAGAINNTNKLYFIGAESQTANPQTYTNEGVYMTNGYIHCAGLVFEGVVSVIVDYNSTSDGFLFEIDTPNGSCGYLLPAQGGGVETIATQEWVEDNVTAGPKGDKGDEGLGIFRTSSNTTTATTTIDLSTITVPTGRSIKAGDLIIGNTTYSYLYRVISVANSGSTKIVYLSYITSLRGATGAAGTTSWSSLSDRPFTSYKDITSKAYPSNEASTTTYNDAFWIGHTLIIMGIAPTTQKTTQVSFPTSINGTTVKFSQTPLVFTSMQSTADTQSHRSTVTAHSTTGFTLGNNTGQAVVWIAIGYM